MISELVVDVQPKEVSIAVLEDKNLVELQKEARNVSFAVGDIYLGKVKKLMPGLNAAFIDVGYKKDAFLHYLDLGPNFNTQQKFLKQTLGEQKGDKKLPVISKMQLLPEIEKDGSISNVLKVGQEVLVQIAKEPISTKGPRLTSELSFAGRYIVLIPFADKVSVSTKIKSSEERARLRQLIQSIKPKNFSVIVRTSSEGKRVAELDHELKTLLKRWEENIPKITKVKAPALIYEETARAVALLRDIFNPSFQNIYVNDADIYHNIRDYVSLIAPGREEIVQRYTGELPHLRQLCNHQTDQVPIRTHRHVQKWSLFDYRTHGSHARYRRKQREPLKGQRCPGKNGDRREHGSGRRNCPPITSTRYGWHYRSRLHRYVRSSQPAETV